MMFYKQFVLFTLFLICFRIDAQTVAYSNETLSRIDKASYVWGFVKYHSVKKANWNKEFVKLYKQAKSSKTDEKLDIFLNKWIKKYYIKNGCDFITRYSSIDLKLLFAFPLLTTAKEDTTLSKYQSGSYLPEYFYEEYEKDNLFPNEAQRVMALHKIFFHFLYFFPHFEISIPQWDSIRLRNIPIFMEANTPIKYELAVNLLLANLNDGHISAHSPAINQYFLKFTCPLKAKLTDSSALIQYIDKNSFCTSNNIRVNDEVIEINGQSIGEKLNFWKNILPHSNSENFKQIASRYIFSDSINRMNITFKRGDSIFKKSIQLYEMGEFIINYDTISYKIISDTVGWINLSVLKREEVLSISKELNAVKILVIDARGYPNSTIDLLCKWLMDEPKPFAIFSKPQINCLGEFVSNDTVYTEYNSAKSYMGKLVIICDASSVSQAEYSILALKTFKNSVLIGEHTGGTAGYTTTFNLPGKIICRMPVTGFRGLNDTVQGTGIKPDVFLKFSNEIGVLNEENIWKIIVNSVSF